MAAGASRRMKAIKQLLPWKDSTLLTHTIETLQKVQKEHIYVVLGANSNEIKIQTNLENRGVAVIQNPTWRNGLGNSISCGIKNVLEQKVSFDGVLICLADQPLLPSDYYQSILYEFQSVNNPIVATKYPNKNGVPALFQKSIALDLLTLDSDYGARDILSKHKKNTSIVDPKGLIKDIDTHEEYLKLYKQYN